MNMSASISQYKKDNLVRYEHPEIEVRNLWTNVRSEFGYLEEKRLPEFEAVYREQYIDLHIEMVRDPHYLIYTLILPLLLLNLMSAFGFLLPSDAGLKINVQLMMLLTQAVYISILSDKLSPNKLLPNIVYDIVIILIVSSIGTLSSLALYRTIEKAEDPPSPKLFKVFHVIGRALLVGKFKSNVIQPLEDSHLTDSRTDVKDYQDLLPEVKYLADYVRSNERESDVRKMWSYLSLVIDRAIFMGLLIAVLNLFSKVMTPMVARA